MFELSDFCRICTRADCLLLDITAEDSDNIKYIDKLTYCVVESLDEIGVLPDLICDICCDNLKVSYSFKTLCLKTKELFTGREGDNDDDDENEEIDYGQCSSTSNFKPAEMQTASLETYLIKDEDEDEIESIDECKETCTQCGVESENFFNLDSKIICNKCVSECVACSEKFLNSAQLQKHYVDCHSEVTPDDQSRDLDLICKICNFHYSSERLLKVHMRVHSNERPYKCPICQEGFMWQHHLQRHKKECRPGTTYPCTLCKYKFMNQAQLQTHMKQHDRDATADEEEENKKREDEEDNPFECFGCDKRFATNDKLSMHRRTHNTGKKHTCKICNKSFTQIGYLSYHQRIHTGERPFKCKICDSAFTQKNTLVNHMRVHDKNRRVQCWVCKKYVRYVVSLRVHLKSLHDIDYRKAKEEMKAAILNSM